MLLTRSFRMLARMILLLGLCAGGQLSTRYACLAEETAQNDPRLPTLRLIETHLQQNYDKILTWSAKGELIDGSMRDSDPTLEEPNQPGDAKFPEKSWEEREVSIEFHLDRKANQLFTTYETIADTQVLDPEDRVPGKTFVGMIIDRNLLTADEWLQVHPDPGESEKQPIMRMARGEGVNSGYRRARAVAEQETRSPSFNVIDPMHFFVYSGNRTYADGLRGCADALQVGMTSPLRITEEKSATGTSYTLRQEYRTGDSQSESPLVVITTFDSACGYLPTRATMTSPKGFLIQETQWRYEQVSDVYVPVWFQYSRYSESALKLVDSSREITMREIQINKPIDPKCFSLQKLGLIEGDQVRDEINRRIQRFQNGKLVDAGQAR